VAVVPGLKLNGKRQICKRQADRLFGYRLPFAYRLFYSQHHTFHPAIQLASIAGKLLEYCMNWQATTTAPGLSCSKPGLRTRFWPGSAQGSRKNRKRKAFSMDGVFSGKRY